VPDEYVPRVIAFLRRLTVEIKQYYSSEHERAVNYEELFYVAAQIYDSEVGEYENPIVQPFVDKILPDIKILGVVPAKLQKECKMQLCRPLFLP
jgi:hypothetical protein